MRRRSKTSNQPVKARRRKMATPKRRNASKADRGRSSFADRETEVARFKRERDEALEQQKATSEVLRVISSSPGDLEPVFAAILRNATRVCEARFGTLWLAEGDGLRAVATHNAPPGFADVRRETLIRRNPKTAVGRVLITKQPVQIVDLAADVAYAERDPLRVALVDLAGARSLVAVPMLRDDVLVGTINIYRQEIGPFTDKQIELVQNFATQAVIAIENTRLLNELRQRTDDLTESLEQQTATSEVLRVISSSPGELKPVFEAMLENATRICNAKFGVLMLSEEDAFRIVALHGAPPAYADERWREPVIKPHPDVAIGRVVATKQPVQIADIRSQPAYTSDPKRSALLELAGARTMLAVPMLKDSEIVGQFAIYRQEVRPFTDKQIALVQNFAAQAVIAIENARLLNELRESLEQQTATSEVLRVISSSPGNLAPVFEAVLESATRICEARFGTLFRFDGDRYHLAAQFGTPPDLVEFQRQRGPFRPPPGGHLDEVTKTKHIRHTADEAADPNPGKAATLGGARSAIYLPMLKDNELIGALVIYRQEVRPFTDKQIELVKNFAAQAVIAIENARLLSELRESLQQQTATSDVLKVISRSTFDLKSVLDTLVESVARLCEADMASIRRPEGATLFHVASYGAPREYTDYMLNRPIVPERGTAAGRVLLEGKPIQILDVQTDPEYAMIGVSKSAGFHTFLGVPLLREGSPIGVIILGRKTVRAFTDKQIELAMTFADQAVIAIENVRLFESVETRTRELAKSLDDLRTAQDRLVQTEKLASLGQLTAGIAHEIKNPLNFVNNFSSVSVELIDELKESLGGIHLDAKQRADINEIADMLQGNLDKVVQHGKRADSIVKNMLLHSRQGSGEHRPVDINALCEESLNLAYHGARAEKQDFNVAIERSFDPAAGEVNLFPQEVTRVLLNLISNGFYAANKRRANGGDDEPTLTVTTNDLGHSVEIRIRDNGTGIAPEVKEKMFNPFFTTKPAGEGTGLGLSISHDIIVKQHNGTIEVETQPGAFTEFRIVLPRGALNIPKSGENA